MPNDIGKLRRSTIVSTFAPGAVVDFRADHAAISGVVAGLEEWDANFPQAGLRNPQRINEPRLERKLGVKGFRLPPVLEDAARDQNGNPDTRRLVATRFPQWLQCPTCDRIATARRWGDEPGKAARFCVDCTRRAPGKRKVYVVPVRFVMACRAGHLDDFPWHWWVGHTPTCTNKDGALLLKAERPGLSGIYVSCPSCKQKRSLDGIFSENTWNGFSCKGRRPWLGGADQTCQETPRALQRGASNLYFPVVSSALSIPAWSDDLQAALGLYWQDLVHTPPGDRPGFISVLARGSLRPVLEELRLTPEQLATEIEKRVNGIAEPDILDIRGGEYRQFTLANGYCKETDREFETRVEPVPASLAPCFTRIVRVVRLREVRALKGFTRINPPGDEDDAGMAQIALTPPPREWLPAIEVRGEGVFLEFSLERLNAWNTARIKERAEAIDEAWRKEWVGRGGDEAKRRRITARLLLLHTFAHALMRQLTLECGYSSASLRERLYVREEEGAEMAGVLIYTGTSDADGTLGGLQRQGEAGRIERTVVAAIQSMEWCSSDPLCIEGVLGGGDGLSKASCHACVLAPETACEEFNRFLDRALLVGVPEWPQAGYFADLLRA